MIETLREALASGAIGALLAWVAVALLALLVFLGWVRWLGTHRPSCRALALVVSGCALLCTFGVLSVAQGHERSRLQAETRTLPARIVAGGILVFPLAAPLEGPTASQPTAVLLPPGSSSRAARRELRLDLVSFLHNGDEIPDGRIVAWVKIQGPGCGNLRYPLRAGFETAETALDRAEVAPRSKHGIENATVAHSWWQDDDSSRHYWGHAYLASWPVPSDCRPGSVALQVERHRADLEVRRLVLAAVQEGS